MVSGDVLASAARFEGVSLDDVFERIRLQHEAEGKKPLVFTNWKERLGIGRPAQVPVLSAARVLEEARDTLSLDADERLRLSFLHFAFESNLLPTITAKFEGGAVDYSWLYSPDDVMPSDLRPESVDELSLVDLASRDYLHLRARDWLAEALEGQFDLFASALTVWTGLIGNQAFSHRGVEFAYQLGLCAISFGCDEEAFLIAEQALSCLESIKHRQIEALGFDDHWRASVKATLTRLKAVAAGFMYFAEPQLAGTYFDASERCVRELEVDGHPAANAQRLKHLRELLRFACRLRLDDPRSTKFGVATDATTETLRLVTAKVLESGQIVYEPYVVDLAKTLREYSELLLPIMSQELPRPSTDTHALNPIDIDTYARSRAVFVGDLRGAALTLADAYSFIDRSRPQVLPGLRDPGDCLFTNFSLGCTDILIRALCLRRDARGESNCRRIYGKTPEEVRQSCTERLEDLIATIGGEQKIKHFRNTVNLLARLVAGTWKGVGN